MTELVTARLASLVTAGAIANDHAARAAFNDYQSRRADNTLRRQRADLVLFAEFLAAAGIPAAPTGDELYSTPRAWRGVTWGLVEGWRNWSLQQGYSVGSVNVRLSTIKTYAKLATKAGALDPSELAMIRTVGGYSQREGRRVDERREVTRKSTKKAEAVGLTPAQIKQLKRQPNTPQGRRDAVIMALLLDHGLRVGELAGLQVTDVDLAGGRLRFYRPKVDMMQTHKLSRDAKAALRAYFDAGDAPAMGKLLRASYSANRLGDAGISERNISERVRNLAGLVGIVGLSAHDLRHAWATQAARNGTPVDRLQDAGGWASPAMPLRYVEAAAVSNDGVKLGEE
jgi:integrase